MERAPDHASSAHDAHRTLLALVLAAALGGASGVIWHWFAGDELPVAEDAASAEPEDEPSATPSPTPTIRPPQPSPGGG